MTTIESPIKSDKKERFAVVNEISSANEGDLVVLEERAKSLDSTVAKKRRIIEASSPEGKEALAELTEIQQELQSVFARAIQSVSEVVGMPSEFIRTYFEAKHDKELQIPDNTKVINRIRKTLLDLDQQYIKNKVKKKGKFYVGRYSGEQFKQIEKIYADFILANKQNLDKWDRVGDGLLSAIYTQTLGVLSEINDWEKISDDYCQDRDSIKLSDEDNKKIDDAIELWRMSFAVDKKHSSYYTSSKQGEVSSRLYRLVMQNFKQEWESKKKQMEIEGKSDEEISKEQLKERNKYLLKYPEIAAKFFLNAQYESNLTSDKQHEIFSILSKNKENSLLLAEFNLKGNNLRPEKLSTEDREVLFEVYFEKAPHKIYWSAEIFHEELNKLPEEKVISLIISAIKYGCSVNFITAKFLSVVRMSSDGYATLQKQFPQIGSPTELAKANPLFAVRNFELCGIDKDKESEMIRDLTKPLSTYEEVALWSEILKHPDSYSVENLDITPDAFFQKIGNIILNKGHNLYHVFDALGLAIKSNLLSAPQLDSLRSLLLSDGFSIYLLNSFSTNLSESFGTSQRVFNEKDDNQKVAMEYVYGIDFGKQDIDVINESIKAVVLENASSSNALIDLLHNVKGKERADVVQKIADSANRNQFLEFIDVKNYRSFSEEEKHTIAKRALIFGNDVSIKLSKTDFNFLVKNYRDDFLQSITNFSSVYNIIEDYRFTSTEKNNLFLRFLKTANHNTDELVSLLNNYNIQDLSEEAKIEGIRVLLNISPQYIGAMCQQYRGVMYKNFLPEILMHLGIQSVFDLLDGYDTYRDVDRNEIAEYYLKTILSVDELNKFVNLCYPQDYSMPKVRLSDNGIKILIQKMIELGGVALKIIYENSRIIFDYSTEEQKKLLFERVVDSGDVDLALELVFPISSDHSNDSTLRHYFQDHPEVKEKLEKMVLVDKISEKTAIRFSTDIKLFVSLTPQQQEQCIHVVMESENIDFICSYLDDINGLDPDNYDILINRFPRLKSNLINRLFELAVQQKSLKPLQKNLFQLTEAQRLVLYDMAIELEEASILLDAVKNLTKWSLVVPKKVIDYLVEHLNSLESVDLYELQNYNPQPNQDLSQTSARSFELSSEQKNFIIEKVIRTRYGTELLFLSKKFTLSSEQERSLIEKIISSGPADSLLYLYRHKHNILSTQDLERMSERFSENSYINDIIEIIDSPAEDFWFSSNERSNLVKKHLQKDSLYNKLLLFNKIGINNNILSEQERSECATSFIQQLFLEDGKEGGNEIVHGSMQALSGMLNIYGELIKSEFARLISEQTEHDVRKRLLSRGSELGILSFEILKEETEKNPVSSAELFTNVSEINPSDFWNFAELIKHPDFPPRDAQLFMSFMVSDMIKKGEYTIFDQYDLAESESPRLGKEIKDLVESYKIGDKGKTIIVLLFAREFGQTKDPKELSATIKDEILKYKKVLDTVGSATFPEGSKASIGMEYEVSNSIANDGYVNATGSSDYKKHILRMSKYASIGQGNDAVHEIATQPTDNPYAMLLEMQLLQDLEFIDFNFEKDGFEKGGRGYHLTIGGERGLQINESMNVLQNLLVMSGWGGVNAGKNVNVIAHGRGVNIRQRAAYGAIKVFENAAPAVEFRSLSLDKKEPFERCVMTSYFGSVAIQTLEKIFPNSRLDLEVVQRLIDSGSVESSEKSFKNLREILNSTGAFDKEIEPTKQEKEIIFEWLRLITSAVNQTQDHNNNFYDTEAAGYIDEQGNWVDTEEFGGQQNASRFESIVAEKKITLEEYLNNTKIDPGLLFVETSVTLANSLTAINNLFLKPSDSIGGDRANALAMLETTKLGNGLMEEVKGRGLRTSLVDTQGKGREGYYNLQGGSERMLVHAVQKAILTFNERMKNIIFVRNDKIKD